MQDLGGDTRAPPRKMTAIGTVGEAGQLFAVYEKNWHCPECNQENYASKKRCSRCRQHKPEGTNNYIVDPALQAVQSGQKIPWKEAIDPTTYQIYYYNTETNVTQWERPAELGPAPHATGWFGRGQSAAALQMYLQKNLVYLSRPARKQKDFIDPKKYHLEGANEYNIWYGRFLGDHWTVENGKDAATDRCHLETDAGYTKADTNTKNKGKKYFCLHFAHGACAKGKDCTFYHRIPTPEDDARIEELVDCFGRQRHAKHRDDMSGVGSFMKPCRTLFVGGLLKEKYEGTRLQEVLHEHFSEWGEVENVNIVYRLSTAFVRYRLRTNAEFAKEAMSNQSLEQGEILCVRWAHDDPNPVAQDAMARADKDALYALMQAKGISLANTGFQYPAEYKLPEAKRIKLDNGAELIENNPALAYPDTDAQYTTDTTVSPAATTAPPSSSAATSSDWTEHVDDETGATYYYNEKTGESSWGAPPV